MADQEPHSPTTPPTTGRTGLSARLLGGGIEPDPRFTLANERTFLAWIRTALAFLAGGVALEAFAGDVFPTVVRTGLAITLLLVGMVIAAGATTRWIRVERAMRHSLPLPLPWIAPVLATGAAIATGIMLGVLIFR
ncbi:DUF202 domain-containing protein [Kocuria sp. JC486]|uniref:DUF202 domain-containing protein n=1 Tax=Kocuria soli TaxID=2485125 RepID=A0A3N3ZWG0_9MICC|nr:MULTISPECIES: DUF202 domain-containing protein [Kocuria]NHU86005.1 DUF202 domain-containing protein [Kocuria sp. JC486]ROZ65743.1 DUF202 domain-containing protein [Kocuria soli]